MNGINNRNLLLNMHYIWSTSQNTGKARGESYSPCLEEFIIYSRNQSYKTGMGIITKELYKIKFIFSNMVKLCSERDGLTKESILKIILIQTCEWSQMPRE